MTPESPTDPRQALEASLTAMLLGELPEDQAAFLRQAIASDAELARMHERLKVTIGLVRETAASPAPQAEAQAAPLKLSEERRQELLQRFKTVEPKEFSRKGRRVVLELAVAAGLVAVLGSLMLPSLSKSKTRGRSVAFRTWGSAPNSLAVNEAAPLVDSASMARPKREATEVQQLRRLASSTTSRAPTAKPAQTTIVLPATSELADANVRPAPDARAESLAQTKEPLGAFPSKDSSGLTLRGGGGAVGSSGSASPVPALTTWSANPSGSYQLNDRANAAGDKHPAMVPPVVSPAPEVAFQGTSPAPTPPTLALNQAEAPQAIRSTGSLPPGATISALEPTMPPPASGPAGTVVNSGDVLPGASQAGVAPEAVRRRETAEVLALTGASTQDVQKTLQDLFNRDNKARLNVNGNESLATAQPAPVFNGTPNDASEERAFRERYGLAWTAAAGGIAGRKLEEPTTNLMSGGGGGVGGGFGGTSVTSVTASIQGFYDNAKLAKNENRASSFDWYLGNQLNAGSGGRIDSQGGTATARTNPTKATAGDAYFSIVPETRRAVTITDRDSGNLVSQAVSNSDQAKVPVVADLPQVGKLFRSESNIVLPQTDGAVPVASPSAGTSKLNVQPIPQQLASAEKKLDELQRFRTVLVMKMGAEGADLGLGKSKRVEIVDRATPMAPEKTTLGDKLRSVFNGQVERSARVKIERDQPETAGVSPAVSAGEYDPYFVQTEFEVIQSEPVLGRVVQELRLDEEFAKKKGAKVSTGEAIALLKKQLDFKPVRGTDVVEIGARSKSPEEAAKIANAVSEAYRDYRLEQRGKLALGGVEQLKQQMDEESAHIRDAESNVDYLRKKLNIPDAKPAPDAVGGVNRIPPITAVSQQVDAAPPKPPLPLPEPQPEIQTRENAFSTFSMNVSDVSFKLAAASLEKGVLPDPGSIRSEEFINAFDYRDPEPAAGAPVSFAWERGSYPFAQGRDLLRFSIKTAAQGRQPGRPLNLVLLLDNSGSMERADRVQMIHEALRVLATQLSPQDVFSVVTFARTPRLWVDGVPGSQAGQVAEEVSGLTPQGGTNLGDALDLAYQTALRHYLANGINRVVLLTDGAANLGDVDPNSLKTKVEANRKQGIALDCFGIGWEGYNDDLLEMLTRNADGRYGFLNTPEEAVTEFAGQLAGALRVAANDVKVQVEFNPNRVTAYRQIGYAKLQLTKEQFRDNTVNAAQIGAAESGNALYVIDVNGGGDGPLATVRVRYRVPGTAEYHEQEWTVPYTGTAALLEQSSPALRLAAAAGAFSEWLATSPYAGEVTPDRLLGYLTGIPQVYGADARPQKLEWMIRQAKSLVGK